LIEVTTEQIQNALGELESPIDRYTRLQHQVRMCDVSVDKDFQRSFVGFYKVRRNHKWKEKYFGIMEAAKSGTSFADALHKIADCTDRIEASFASKLVATLDPSKPVIDKFVLEHFGMRLPHFKSENRKDKTTDLYERLRERYDELLDSKEGRHILEHFDRCYPGAEVSELKKIDLVLWQIRKKQ
jgi:hypothetical protein